MLAKTKRAQKEAAYFPRQLAMMLSAGIPLVPSLEIIAKASTPAQKLLIRSLKRDIEKGLSFAQTLQKHPLDFNGIYCHLVAAGELSGTLEQMLDTIADHQEKIDGLRHKIKKALFYPSLVCMMALAICILLLTVVIPQFEALFHQFKAELPLFTKTILWCSHCLQRYWWVLLCSLLVLPYVLAAWQRTWWLKLPAIGPLLHKAMLARFSQTLATLTCAGIPLSEGLFFAANTTGCDPMSKKLAQIREKIAIGMALHQSIRQTGLFPHFAVQMIAVGESTGSLGPMLAKIAGHFEQEVDQILSYLTSLLEPLFMLMLGILVGGLMIGMYLPIFKMGAIF